MERWNVSPAFSTEDRIPDGSACRGGLRLNGKALIRMELAREEFTGVELQGRVVRVQRQADAAVLCHKGVRAVEHEAMVKVLRNGVRRAEVATALGRRSSPVGISSPSTGIQRPALICSVVPRMLSVPPRLKYMCVVGARMCPLC